jgi:cysteine--tRNA ligase
MVKKIFCALAVLMGLGIAGMFCCSFFEMHAGAEREMKQAEQRRAEQETAEAKAESIDYRAAMEDLIVEMNDYADAAAGRNFMFITNGGTGIYAPDETHPRDRVERLLNAVDGALIEDFFYGWDMEDDLPPPAEEQAEQRRNLRLVREAHRPVFNIDYTHKDSAVRGSQRKNKEAGFIGFAASRRELDEIPFGTIVDANARDVHSLGDVRNFIALLNPARFRSKEDYIEKLRRTDYDLLIIDLVYNDAPLTKEDVEALKVKANGGRRLVFAYMSVGEAEDYRIYWKDEWNKHLPVWIDEMNDDWEGNYKVRYWTRAWQDLLYGSADGYLDKIIAAGFDGAFLDVIDAYDYFYEKEGH